MYSNSPFKAVFIGLSALVLLLLTGAYLFIFSPSLFNCIGSNHTHFAWRQSFPMFLPLIIFATLFFIGVLATIATTVYRDAAKRGLDPWCWATVATFVPNLIGVIIYLVVRYYVKKVCIACGRGIQGDYLVCPYCGRSQNQVCPHCQKTVNPEWKACPYCAQPLTPIGGEGNGRVGPR